MYKVGDWVRIVDADAFNPQGFSQRMRDMVGEVQQIQHIRENGAMELNANYYWMPDHVKAVLEPADKGPVVRKRIPMPFEVFKIKLKPIPVRKKTVHEKSLYTKLKEQMNGTSGTVSYALRYKYREDGIHAKDICNARMKWPYGVRDLDGDEMTEIVMDVSVAIMTHLKDKDVALFKTYLKYILTESPWASCFTTKRVADAMRYGVKFNLDMDVSAIVGAAIAIREGWEYKAKLQPFTALLKDGYVGNVAYLVSSFVGPSKANWVINGMGSSHQVLSRNIKWTAISKFFKRGYLPYGKDIKNTAEANYRIFERIGIMGDDIKKDSLLNIFKGIAGCNIVGRGWEAQETIPADGVKKLAEWLTLELKG